MLSRRQWMIGWALTSLGFAAAAAEAQQPAPTTGDASLKETLLYGLKPRTPTEEDFIDAVVTKVEAKQLPLPLVVQTFRYAQGKKPYPFPFFHRALIIRARQLGIDL